MFRNTLSILMFLNDYVYYCGINYLSMIFKMSMFSLYMYLDFLAQTYFKVSFIHHCSYMQIIVVNVYMCSLLN